MQDAQGTQGIENQRRKYTREGRLTRGRSNQEYTQRQMVKQNMTLKESNCGTDQFLTLIPCEACI